MSCHFAAPGLVARCALALPSLLFGILVLCDAGGTGAACWLSETAAQPFLNLAQAIPFGLSFMIAAFLLGLVVLSIQNVRRIRHIGLRAGPDDHYSLLNSQTSGAFVCGS